MNEWMKWNEMKWMNEWMNLRMGGWTDGWVYYSPMRTALSNYVFDMMIRLAWWCGWRDGVNADHDRRP